MSSSNVTLQTAYWKWPERRALWKSINSEIVRNVMCEVYNANCAECHKQKYKKKLSGVYNTKSMISNKLKKLKQY